MLDAFAGSGSSIAAAEQVGRRAFCIEIDPRYADVAIRRWQKLTGRDAVLEFQANRRSMNLRRGEKCIQTKSEQSEIEHIQTQEQAMRRKKPAKASSEFMQSAIVSPRCRRVFNPAKVVIGKGRPKGIKNMTTLLVEALHKKVKVAEGGRYRWYTVLELLVRKVIAEASKGNVRLIEMLMSLPEPRPKADTASDFDARKMTAEEAQKVYFALIKNTATA